MAQTINPLVLAELRSSGRLWAFFFKKGEGQAIAENGEAPVEADWHWSHFALSDYRSRLHLERLQELPEAARSCLLAHEVRVHAQVDDGWSYGVLPDFEHPLESNESGVCRLNFAFDSHCLITTRRHALEVVDLMRREIERRDLKLGEPAEAIAAHIARYIDVTADHLGKLSAELDQAEDHLLSDGADVSGIRLGPIRRELSTHHRAFVALRSALHRTYSRRGAKSGALVERLPPLLLEIEDCDRDLSGLQDRAKLLHDELESKISAAANRSLGALTILSTLLLPPTLIVGAFGMNVRGVPFAEQGGGFWPATALCAIVVLLCYWGLKQTRIL